MKFNWTYLVIGVCMTTPMFFSIYSSRSTEEDLDGCEKEKAEYLETAAHQGATCMDWAVENDRLKIELAQIDRLYEKAAVEIDACNEDWVDHKLQYPDETWSRGDGPKAGKGESQRRCEFDLSECYISEEDHRRARDEYASELADCVKGDKVHEDLSTCLGSWGACKELIDHCVGGDTDGELSSCLAWMKECKQDGK